MHVEIGQILRPDQLRDGFPLLVAWVVEVNVVVEVSGRVEGRTAVVRVAAHDLARQVVVRVERPDGGNDID